MGRLSRGLTLTRASLRVMRREPSLLVFPLLSAVVILAVLVVSGGLLGLGALLAGGIGGTPGGGFAVNLDIGGVAGYALLFGVYFLGTVVATFFNAALVHNAAQVLRGDDPSVGDGLRAAWAVKGKIALWGVIAATVGVIIGVIEENSGVLGDLLAGLFEFAWALLTFFVIPVIVFEEESGMGMLTRSGRLFKETWGETAVAHVSVSIVGAIAGVVGVVVAVALGWLLATLFGIGGAIAVGVLFVVYLVVLALATTALSGVARTALYLYAVEGRVGFDDVDMQHVLQ